MGKQIDSKDFRQIMGCFATGIAVATAQNKKLGSYGLTINSLTSVSLDPPLILFCLDKGAFLHPHFKAAKFFAINILSQGQEDVSRHFASRQQPVPDHLWGEPQQDCPVLRGTLGWIVCRPYARHKGGDHTIFVGEVVALHKHEGEKEPLLYFKGAYRSLGKLTSGALK